MEITDEQVILHLEMVVFLNKGSIGYALWSHIYFEHVIGNVDIETLTNKSFQSGDYCLIFQVHGADLLGVLL